ncbi:hypothetical protein [Streptomyces sp. MMS24-I29]|uniref:hypothetical protein n=1 Tax=Streptomyces sp. MMS24-I29 TaxID=3351480 RepID=UPI003C7C5E56
MTARTLDRTEPEQTDETGTAAAPAHKPAVHKPVEKKNRRPAKARRPWKRLPSEKRGTGLPVVIWTVFIRLVVLIADYLLAYVTATVVIPMLGAWLHQQSGASQGALTSAGTIAMWLTPLLFLVLLMAAGVLVLMRGLWRWGTRMIQKVRDGRTGGPGAAPSRAPAPQTETRNKKNTRKRSK